MASVCEDIMLSFGEAMLTDTEAAHGQEWFGMFYEIARSLERQYTEEELDWEKILKDHLRNE